MRTSRPALAVSILAVALLWPPLAATQEPSAQDRPVRVDGRPVPELHGLWRSRGYGYIVRIGHDGYQLFHTAGGFCYPDDVDQGRTGILSKVRAAFLRLREFTFRHILRAKRDPDDMFAFYRPL